jgi:HD-like signal output (HDOD) protein
MNKPYDIEALLDEVITLPSLPGTVAHVIRLVSDPQCSLAAVAQAIAADPPLAIRTLRPVNTAYYGLRQKVATIEHAVVLLGIKVIKNLAFTASVFDILQGSVEPFFRHCVACGMAMRSIVEVLGSRHPIPSPQEAFTCGLLHDIGKVILAEFLPKECDRVAATSRARRIPWYEAERLVIGVDHAAIGGRLAQKWGLPDMLVGGIAGHHDLRQAGDAASHRIAALVSVADYLCSLSGIAADKDAVVYVVEEVWTASELASRDAPPIMDAFIKALPAIDELMRLAG